MFQGRQEAGHSRCCDVIALQANLQKINKVYIWNKMLWLMGLTAGLTTHLEQTVILFVCISATQVLG